MWLKLTGCWLTTPKVIHFQRLIFTKPGIAKNELFVKDLKLDSGYDSYRVKTTCWAICFESICKPRGFHIFISYISTTCLTGPIWFRKSTIDQPYTNNKPTQCPEHKLSVPLVRSQDQVLAVILWEQYSKNGVSLAWLGNKRWSMHSIDGKYQFSV